MLSPSHRSGRYLAIQDEMFTEITENHRLTLSRLGLGADQSVRVDLLLISQKYRLQKDA